MLRSINLNTDLLYNYRPFIMDRFQLEHLRKRLWWSLIVVHRIYGFLQQVVRQRIRRAVSAQHNFKV